MTASKTSVTNPTSGTVTPDLLMAVAALAEAAGQAALRFYGGADLAVSFKDGGSPVTAADHAAHEVIVGGLRQLTPDVPVVSEEGDIPTAETRSQWRRFWLVDPLDGTKEFISKNGEFTVNIALIQDGVPVLGVVVAPAVGRTYYAAAGLGAWRRDEGKAAIPVRSVAPEAGAPVRIVESRSHPSPELEAFLATQTVAERVLAGSSLKFCLVAEGAADLYPRFGPTMEWDTAAGDAVFRYSGIGRPRRSSLRYNQPDLRHQSFVIGGPESGPGAVVWMTGLSGAGKSTIALDVVARLRARGVPVEYLDGDVIRDVFPSTGFSREDRDAHIRRVGYLASRLEAHGVTVVCALVSPYRSSRDFVRGLCRRFVEVYVATSLAECERRDVKGLYARARKGEIANLTGIGDVYEAPERPEVLIATEGKTVEASSAELLDYLDRGV